MKLAIGLVSFFLVITATAQTQTITNGATYTVQGAAPQREALLRHQIQVMQPTVLPYRIRFVPHWQYVYAAKIYQLHVPAGMGSKMFTHLPSRSVFVDEDRYLGEEWLGHWIAHELGHLATNSVREEDAEKAAREYRIRLRAAAKKNQTSSQLLINPVAVEKVRSSQNSQNFGDRKCLPEARMSLVELPSAKFF
jgi:hypothetical protein